MGLTDITVASFTKSFICIKIVELLIVGTHWTYEVISMLLKGKAENTQIPKIASMLEMHPREKLEELPSPRVLNSHLPLYMLPRQIKGN